MSSGAVASSIHANLDQWDCFGALYARRSRRSPLGTSARTCSKRWENPALPLHFLLLDKCRATDKFTASIISALVMRQLDRYRVSYLMISSLSRRTYVIKGSARCSRRVAERLQCSVSFPNSFVIVSSCSSARPVCPCHSFRFSDRTPASSSAFSVRARSHQSTTLSEICCSGWIFIAL
jgi:hypothetical protein